MIISLNAIFLLIFNHDHISRTNPVCDECINHSRGGKRMIAKLHTCKSMDLDNKGSKVFKEFSKNPY